MKIKAEKIMTNELSVEEFERLKHSFMKFCKMTIATDAMVEEAEIKVKVPAKIKWLAELSANYFHGQTLDVFITDAVTDYLTRED